MCKNYVKEGYCHFDGWTKLNCQYSCNLCPSPDVVKRQVETSDVRAYLEAYRKGDCFNRYDDLRCEVFAERGDCRTNPGFMSSQCTQSCGLCPEIENRHPNISYTQSSHTIRLPTPCRNYIDDQRCDALAKEVNFLSFSGSFISGLNVFFKNAPDYQNNMFYKYRKYICFICSLTSFVHYMNLNICKDG
ncbi:unnamed protein product [Schistosoma margrebowiei]|uniref:Uncharacterized protein n=1 Tax=Schistosoma margrebowiei TaxID=48269 RepID=A0A183L9K2_9TREM|nr:unnamed protein product [Schistosoma margrebowiei]